MQRLHAGCTKKAAQLLWLCNDGLQAAAAAAAAAGVQPSASLTRAPMRMRCHGDATDLSSSTSGRRTVEMGTRCNQERVKR